MDLMSSARDRIIKRMRAIISGVAASRVLLVGCGRLNYDEQALGLGADAATQELARNEGHVSDPGSARRTCRTGIRRQRSIQCSLL